MAGQSIPLGAQLLLGRGQSGAGSLSGDRLLSRQHARFARTADGHYLVEDLGSTNGTFVNGERVTAPRLLQDGDRSAVGETTLEFVFDPEATRVPRAAPAPASPPAPVQPYATPPPPPPRPAPASSPGPTSPPGYAPSPPPAPAYASPPPRRTGGAGKWLAAFAAVAVIAAAAGAGAFFGLRDDSGGTTPPEGTATTAPGTAGSPVANVPPDCGDNLGGGEKVGFVAYVESNLARENANSVLLMPYRAGDLAPLPAAQCLTGGSGSADLTDSGVLDADNQVILNADHSLLFAVNQGSDTIAVFQVQSNGGLKAVAGSPFPSGGTAPASLGLSGDVLVVANKAQDGIRDLAAVQPNYTTFRVGPDGKLARIPNSNVTADPGSSPTDAYVAPGGKAVFGTEESGPLRGFGIDGNGVLKQAANSPLAPDAAIFGPGFNPAKEFGLGIVAHPKAKVVYIGMPTVPALAVYSYDDAGTLTFVKSVPVAGAYLPCWIVATPDGRWIYTANAATGNVTTFDVSDPTTPKQIQTFAFEQPGNPWNEAIAPTGHYLFVNTPRDTLGVPEGEGNTQHVLAIGPDGMLTEVAGSPAAIPVSAGVNPQGLAVLALGG